MMCSLSFKSWISELVNYQFDKSIFYTVGIPLNYLFMASGGLELISRMSYSPKRIQSVYKGIFFDPPLCMKGVFHVTCPTFDPFARNSILEKKESYDVSGAKTDIRWIWKWIKNGFPVKPKVEQKQLSLKVERKSESEAESLLTEIAVLSISKFIEKSFCSRFVCFISGSEGLCTSKWIKTPRSTPPLVI